MDTTGKPNLERLTAHINSRENPQAYMDLLAAILTYGKTIRQAKQSPKATPVPAKAVKEDVSPVIEEIDSYIERSHLPEAKARYDVTWGQISALRTLSLTDPSKALLHAFCFGRAKGFRMGIAETKRKEAQA